MQNLDVRLLLTLRSVVAAGGISAGARALHLSQPAVTAQIRQLEEQCGRPLLLRSARGVTPTAAGRVLVACADRVQGALDEALQSIGGDREPAGELCLGASTTIAAHVLPPLVAAFGRERGGMGVRVEVGNTEQVLRLLRDGAVPLGLVEGHSRAAGVHLEPFLPDELIPVVAEGAPAALRRPRHAADLKAVPILWREPGSGTRAVVERALRKAIGRRPPFPGDVQIGSTEAIRAATLAGLGVAFLSRRSIRVELDAGRLQVLPLKDLVIPRNFSWAMPAGDVTGIAGRFWRFARENGRALAG